MCTLKTLAVAAILLTAGVTAGLAQTGSPGTVTVTYTLQRIHRIAANQLAVWIEDGEGHYVRTLFATDFLARRQGFRRRPQACPLWVQASGLASWSREAIDAVSAATQKPGPQRLEWDCTAEDGRAVPPGAYVYKVEGNIYWDKRVLWTGRIQVGGSPAESTATAEYLPDASVAQESRLVEEVAARFRPRR